MEICPDYCREGQIRYRGLSCTPDHVVDMEESESLSIWRWLGKNTIIKDM